MFLVRLGKPPEETAQHVRTQTHRIQSWEERLQEHVAKNPTVFLDQQYEASTRAAEVSDAAMHNVLDAVLAKATVHRGALQVVDFGRVRTSPNSFHHNRLVFPVGFVARRRFWSYVHAGATTVYTHTIAAVDDKPSFALCAADDPDHPVVGDSPVSAWDALLSRLGAIRPNPRERITGDQSWKEEMFGFTAWVVAAIEAMPGANECYAYNFQFWRRSRSASTTANVAHEYGAARFIPAQVARRAHKVVADPFAYSRAAPSGSGVRRAKGSAKRSRDHRARPVDEEDDVKALPDFVRHHQMLHHPPQLVVHKSRIHGMGVYTLTPIKRRDMVIEYQGEIIRPSVADMRERDYDKRGIPCYLWKVCGVAVGGRSALAHFPLGSWMTPTSWTPLSRATWHASSTTATTPTASSTLWTWVARSRWSYRPSATLWLVKSSRTTTCSMTRAAPASASFATAVPSIVLG